MLQQLRNATRNSSNTGGNTSATPAPDPLEGVVFIEGSTAQYAEMYRTSRFCLAPHGSGFGIRLSIAMVHAW